MVRWPLLLVLGATLTCGERGERAPDPEGARAVVQQVFDAFTAGDCDTIRQHIGGKLGQVLAGEDCDHIRAQFGPMRGQVRGSSPDGRAPGVELVRVQVEGNAKESLIRVQWLDGRWLIVGM